MPGGAYHDAIWTPDAVLLVQIGPYVFVHAGLTDAALDYLFGPGGSGPLAACCTLWKHITGGIPNSVPIPDGLLDLVETRTLGAGGTGTGTEARRLLNRFSQLAAAWASRHGGHHQCATALVVGHETRTAADLEQAALRENRSILH